MSTKLAVQCQCLKKAVHDLGPETVRIFLSEHDLSKKEQFSPREWASEPADLLYTVDYDELCGPWPSPDHPTFKQYDDVTLKPTLYTWKFITVQDMKCMSQNLFNKNTIKFIIEQKLPDSLIFTGTGKEVFLNLAWEIFKFMRDNNFTGKGISSILGLFYLAHRFFLSNCWRSAHETYAFIKDGIDLHAFLKPPESEMIFDFNECDKLLEMFRCLYIQKLELIRSLCIPKYKLIFKIKKCDMENSK